MNKPQRNDFFIGAIIACTFGALIWAVLVIVSLWFLGVL